jgi:hypothetical protein
VSSKTLLRIGAVAALAAAGAGTSFFVGRATSGTSARTTPTPTVQQRTIVVVTASSPKLVQLSAPARVPDLKSPTTTTTNHGSTSTYRPPPTTYYSPTTTYQPPTTTHNTTTIIGGG